MLCTIIQLLTVASIIYEKCAAKYTSDVCKFACIDYYRSFNESSL